MNPPNFFACRWRGTYCCEAVNKGYNSASYFILIGGLHIKLWGSKIAGGLILGILGLPFGSPGTKCHLDVGLVERHRVYYKGEGDGFPQVRAVVSLVNLSLLMACPNTKVLQLCTNQFVVWFVQICVSDKMLGILPSPIPELQHVPLPPKCYKPWSMPQLFIFPLFSLQTHI